MRTKKNTTTTAPIADTASAVDMTEKKVEVPHVALSNLRALVNQKVRLVWGVGKRVHPRVSTGVLLNVESKYDADSGKTRYHAVLGGTRPQDDGRINWSGGATTACIPLTFIESAGAA